MATVGSLGSGGGDSRGGQTYGNSALSSPIVSSGPASVPPNGLKRNASQAGLDSSPTSTESPDAEHRDEAAHGEDRRRQPLKRACNECRQQVKSSAEIYQIPGIQHSQLTISLD